MKIKFNADIEYQKDAIDSTVDLFQGCISSNDNVIDFTLNFSNQDNVSVIKNQLVLDSKSLFNNLKQIQERNNIDQKVRHLESLDFTIEMETGTGKTYIYLRTILELSINYNLNKFIIVVPSVAIREGVKKTLEITETHFKEIYSNITYNYYEYDSNDLGLLKQFAYSKDIEILIMTIDSFNRDSNIINRYHDKIEGQKPIELIQDTNPILILDEPQNMETEIAKKALSNLNPLFCLRYSATHRNLYNLIYRLSPVDAYEKGIVKKIEVLSVVEDDDYSNSYIKVVNFGKTTRGIKVKLEIYKNTSSGNERSITTVYVDDDLYEKSNGLEIYKGYTITEIDLRYKLVKFQNGISLELGQTQGLDRNSLMKVQIEKAVEEHFRKYVDFKEKNIKVLTLFFIDRVDNYIREDGFIRKEFIKAYNKLKTINEKVANKFENLDVNKVHDGYFAKKPSGEYYSDSSIYYMTNNKDSFDLIMRDKERLLSFEENVQFIFSHSALREGWDNPNVFNICTLNESYSDVKKRQEIGRGIRIPIDQNGERQYGEDMILTVIANESYRVFVDSLQKEYSKEDGAKVKEAVKKRNNRITVKVKNDDTLNENERKYFEELWRRISTKSYYRIKLDSNKLIKKCIKEINKITVDDIRIRINRVQIEISEKGVGHRLFGSGSANVEKDFVIKNFIKKIAAETNLTYQTIIQIMEKIDNLNLLYKDPYSFILNIIKVIKNVKQELLLNGIKYCKIGDKYEMSLFQDFSGYKDNLTRVDKSIYEYILTDSLAEQSFAKELSIDGRIKFFVKLPLSFKIPTPIGNYNPDWAIVVEDLDDSGQPIGDKLYLIRETKSTGGKGFSSLRFTEYGKIKCAKEHFNEIFKDYTNTNYKAIDVPEKIVDLKSLIEL